MKCYPIEEHTTNKCPKPKEYKICSECGDRNHTWKDCHSSEKKLVNCDGNHRTIANKCPKRREIENRRKKKGQTGHK